MSQIVQEKEKVYIGAQVDRRQRDALVQLAREHDRSVSSIIRRALAAELEHEDGTPADPPVLHTAVPNWAPGDTIPLDADRMLRVIETRFSDDESVLAVELA